MLRLRQHALRLLVGLVILWIMVLVYPLRNNVMREAIVGLFGAWFVCLMVVLWRRRWLRWLAMAIPAVVGVFLMLPGRPVDRAGLRAAYVERLEAYKGTRYYWGGEGFFGVDCSGLLRAALVDAHARQSIGTLNPALAREALWLWWHDASARDLADPARGLGVPLGWKGPLKDTPQDLLRPGDFAVTADGSHALAYAGDGRWIEADPYDLRVIELIPGAGSQWSNTRVTPCRWRCLDDQSRP